MCFKKVSRFILLLCLSLIVVGTFSISAQAAKKMPEFSLPTAVDGELVESKNLEGKALLITFFATWCPPCRQEIPTLIQMQNEYGPQGFSVIGMSVDEGGRKIVAKLVELENINYPVLMAKQSTASDFGGIPGIPTSFLINTKGNIVKTYQGYVAHAILERDVKSVLQ